MVIRKLVYFFSLLVGQALDTEAGERNTNEQRSPLVPTPSKML